MGDASEFYMAVTQVLIDRVLRTWRGTGEAVIVVINAKAACQPENLGLCGVYRLRRIWSLFG